MKPIKFRQPLWDEHNKFLRWHYWGFIGIDFIEPAFSPYSSLEEAKEQSQQSTGLLDKNGKERYVSDIEESEDGGIYEIVWVQEWAGFFWKIIKSSSYEPGKIYIDIGEIVVLGRQDVKVIGNTTENPWLLEEQNNEPN